MWDVVSLPFELLTWLTMLSLGKGLCELFNPRQSVQFKVQGVLMILFYSFPITVLGLPTCSQPSDQGLIQKTQLSNPQYSVTMQTKNVLHPSPLCFTNTFTVILQFNSFHPTIPSISRVRRLLLYVLWSHSVIHKASKQLSRSLC